MRTRVITVAMTFAVTLLQPSIAAAAEWKIDASKSRLGFTATLEGAVFDGIFKDFSGTIKFDPEAPANSHFEVSVDIASIDTGSGDLDEGMALPEWFHSSRHPHARFVSSAVEPLGDSDYEMDGQLEVKGVKKTVRLPFRWTQDGESARIDGQTVLNRIEFDLGAGDWSDADVVGHEVRVWAELHLVPAD